MPPQSCFADRFCGILSGEETGAEGSVRYAETGRCGSFPNHSLKLHRIFQYLYYHTSEKLALLLERLNQNFICCHRSYLINLNQITDFENNLVTLAGQYKIPVSQKRAVEVKKQFLNMFIK